MNTLRGCNQLDIPTPPASTIFSPVFYRLFRIYSCCKLERRFSYTPMKQNYATEKAPLVPGAKRPVLEQKRLARLNLGCGLQTPRGWLNVDGSYNARLAKHPLIRRALALLHLLPADTLNVPWSSSIFIHDIRKPLPFSDGSVAAIYASHVLEHLYHEEAQRLVKESLRVLAKGGILRVVVPDLEAIIREYIGERPFGTLTGETAHLCRADRVNQRLLMRYPTPANPHVLYRIYDSWKDFHSHKWMYDAESLIELLEVGGFIEVRHREYLESEIEDIGALEEQSRVVNGAGVCVEGVKPPPPG
jgi:predicted SAM-dependent methyltransferase